MLASVFGIYFASTILLALGFPIGPDSLIIALVVIFLVLRWNSGELGSVGGSVGGLVLLFGLYAASILVSNCSFDLSWDGQAYHQEAIIRLAEGWNPFYGTVSEGTAHAALLDHYWKAPWICEATLYVLTGSIEAAKALNLLLMVCTFLIGLSTFTSVMKFRQPLSGVLAFLVAFNPVTVCQVFTFYVDNWVASLIACFMFLCLLVSVLPSNSLYFSIAITIILLVNTKLTGLVYVMILGTGLLLWRWSRLYREKWKAVAVFCLSILLGIGFFGYNPYITNIISRGNPFYGVVGAQKMTALKGNSPVSFRGHDRFTQMFMSLFSESAAGLPKEHKYKFPFHVGKSEGRAFAYPDVRIAGFGPLFGGSLVVSLVMFLWAFLKYRGTYGTTTVYLSILVLVSVVVNPAMWWARYVPQFYWVPLILVSWVVYIARRGLLRGMAHLTIAILILNIGIVTVNLARGLIQDNISLSHQLRALKDTKDPVYVCFGPFRSNRVRLISAGVNFKEIDAEKCKSAYSLVRSTTRICTCEK
jgi:hypothetical protein